MKRKSTCQLALPSAKNYKTSVDTNWILNKRTFLTIKNPALLQGAFVIPENIGLISSQAFENCKALTEVKLSESVHYIGDRAFKNCIKLSKINLPKNIKVINSEVFASCSSLTSIIIPDSIKKIDVFAFKDCKNLTCIVLPKGLKDISTSAFQGCDKLQYIVISDACLSTVESMSNILPSPFNLKLISSKTLDTKIKWLLYAEIALNIASHYRINTDTLSYILNIGLMLFDKKFSNHSDVHFGNQFLSPFNNVSVKDKILIKIKNPNLLESFFAITESIDLISSRAFENCKVLTEVNLSENLYYMGSAAFKNCIRLSKINFSEKIEVISEEVFAGCSSLTSLIIPKNVKKIEPFAFKDCKNLTHITLPRRLKEISISAFEGCDALKYIIIKDACPQTMKYMNNIFNHFPDPLKSKLISTEVLDTKVKWLLYSNIALDLASHQTIPSEVSSYILNIGLSLFSPKFKNHPDVRPDNQLLFPSRSC